MLKIVPIHERNNIAAITVGLDLMSQQKYQILEQLFPVYMAINQSI